MSILSKLFTPIVRGYEESKNTVTEEAADKSALNAKLAAASGIDGVLDTIVSEKKSRKDRSEKKAIRDQILAL